jgi:hypothetical protein
MTSSGDVKLVDFGLARLADQDHEVTVTGQIMGTPAFMSPEQCRGDTLDGRSDLYSLGATLYFLLSGKVPFSGKTPTALLHSVINDPPQPLQSVATDVPDKVVALIQRLMTKHRSTRPQSGHELITEIDEALVGRYSISVERPTPQKPHAEAATIPWGILGTVLLLGLLIFVGLHLAGSTETASATGPYGTPDNGTGTPMIRRIASTHLATNETPPEAAGQDQFYELRERVPDFLETLFSGDADLACPFLDPTEEGIPRLHRSVAGVVELIALGRVQEAQHVTSQTRPGTGRTILTLTLRDDEKVIVTLGWIRVDDAWYVASVATQDDR